MDNSVAAQKMPTPPNIAARLPLYYGWVSVFIAALAMVGTLPGRTQGLGLITEPLMKDLEIGRVEFAQINLWATLIGALFGLGVGPFLDRLGSRVVLTAVAASLGLTVLLMSRVHEPAWLFIFVTLTRGLGQSALSVVSITLVGQWFTRRLSIAMGFYAIALSVGFMLAFPIVGYFVSSNGWRYAWTCVGVALLFGLTPLSLIFVRHSPEACGLKVDETASDDVKPETESESGYTLWQALRAPAFWVFALSSSAYGLIASGISLFNESILAERGFNATIYYYTLAITAMTALIGNFLGGWLARHKSLKLLLCVAMLLLMCALLALPSVHTTTHVAAYAVAMGLVGGAVMVVFFTFWSHAFGRLHLGKIQGAAQTLTVLASAIGPLLLAKCVTLTGSYSMIFYLLAFVVGVLGLCAWFVNMPTLLNVNGNIENVESSL